jgi:HK97 family phage prohead protease
MNMREPEKRITSCSLTLRSAPAGSDSPGVLCGYAAVFNTLSRDLGGFVERLLPGCFDHMLEDLSLDVKCLVNHDPNIVLGRTKSGTLKLRSDSTGLYYECTLPNTSAGRDVAELNKRGDMNECSFAFRCEDGDDSLKEENGRVVRTIRNVSGLFDVSCVTYPAYPGTSAAMRGQMRRAAADYFAGDDLLQMRLRALEVGKLIAADRDTEKALPPVPSYDYRIWQQ